MKGLLLSFIIGLFLVGCSKNELSYEQRDLAYQQLINEENLASVNSINTFRYHNWVSLTRNFLIISTTFKRNYLIKLKGSCNDLVFAQTILINQSQDNTLSARFDSISTPGNQLYFCTIDKIYPLTPEQTENIRNIGLPKSNKDNT
ncbi:DUF6491 family protein [Thalassotalea ganghwensis]